MLEEKYKKVEKSWEELNKALEQRKLRLEGTGKKKKIFFLFFF